MDPDDFALTQRGVEALEEIVRQLKARNEALKPGETYKRRRRADIEAEMATLASAASHWERNPGKAPGQDTTGAEIAAKQRREISALRAELSAVDAEQF